MTEVRFDRWYRPLAAPIGLGPGRCEVTIANGSLHVAMGWGFSADIPLASITDAKPARGPFLGWGVHGWRGRWLVNGSSKGVVELTIDPPVEGQGGRRPDNVAHVAGQRHRPRGPHLRLRAQLK